MGNHDMFVFKSAADARVGINVEQVRQRNVDIVNGDRETSNGLVQKHTFCLNVCTLVLPHDRIFTRSLRFLRSGRIRNKNMHTTQSAARDMGYRSRNLRSNYQA